MLSNCHKQISGTLNLSENCMCYLQFSRQRPMPNQESDFPSKLCNQKLSRRAINDIISIMRENEAEKDDSI